MSITYSAFVMADIGDDPDFAEELRREGLTPPTYFAESSFPDCREVQAIITDLEGCTVLGVDDLWRGEPGKDYQITVESSVGDVQLKVWGSKNPRVFTATKPDLTTLLRILRRLSLICGPLLLCWTLGIEAVIAEGRGGEALERESH